MRVHHAIATAVARTYTRQAAGVLDGPPPAPRPGGTRPRTDRLDLSETVDRFRRLMGAVTEQSDVRPDVVASLRAAVQGGTYRVDPQVLAARLLASGVGS